MKTKRIIAAMVFTLMVGLFVPHLGYTDAWAAGDNGKIKSLTKEFVNFVGVVCSDRPNQANYLARNAGRTYDFSNNKTRGLVASMPGNPVYNPKAGNYHDTNYYAKRMFGKGVKKAPRLILGDWGIDGPMMKNIKVKKGKKGRYEVTFTIIWHDYDAGTDQKLGKGTLSVKKKKGSAYGYVATKLVIKRNGQSIYD